MEFASLRRADGLRMGTSLLPCPVSSRPERPPDSPWGPPFSIGQDAHFPGFIAKSNEVASLRGEGVIQPFICSRMNCIRPHARRFVNLR